MDGRCIASIASNLEATDVPTKNCDVVSLYTGHSSLPIAALRAAYTGSRSIRAGTALLTFGVFCNDEAPTVMDL